MAARRAKVTGNPDGGRSATFVASTYRASQGPSTALLPDNKSGDYETMQSYWKMVHHIVGGTEAMREAGQDYLPQFPMEELDDYQYRLRNSVFTNIYSDIVSNLAAKPFSEECVVDDKAAQNFKDISEDIDGRGNSLHVFAADVFYWGINNAIDWILVDYPKAKNPTPYRALTIADEKAQGLRPYWVHVPATHMLAVYSDCVNSKELFVHARIKETSRLRNGFGELIIERVRIFNREPIFNEFSRVVGYAPATYELWEKQTATSASTANSNWVQVEDGPVTIGVIPIIPFITGKRLGASWQFVPPMRDCAFTQIELYQAETGLKSIKELTAFPMLSGNGVSAPAAKDKQIKVGARVVLYAPPTSETGAGSSSWKYVEPQGSSLSFLSGEIDRIEKQMRELGRQPLTAQSGNLTVVTTTFAAQKGNSAVQAWALNLKDALEQAFYITAQWLNQASASPTVRVFTDFAIDSSTETDQTWITSMATRGRLSTETEWEEAQRRNVLSADFDHDEETARLTAEQPEPPTAAEIAAGVPPPEAKAGITNKNSSSKVKTIPVNKPKPKPKAPAEGK